MVDERFYTLRHDQGYFETGLAGDKQVLLGNTIQENLGIHEIIAHWFDREGRFLSLERFPISIDPSTPTGLENHREVDTGMASLKQRLNIHPTDIRIQAFESEEATIADLPGEYEQYLESPELADPEECVHFPAYIAEWQAQGRFVLNWRVDYWLSADGRVLSHG